MVGFTIPKAIDTREYRRSPGLQKQDPMRVTRHTLEQNFVTIIVIDRIVLWSLE